MHLLGEKPMLMHVIDNLRAAGVEDIVVVASPQIVSYLPSGVKVAVQEQPLGTAHALKVGADQAAGGELIVTSGDMPLIKAETYRMIAQRPEERLVLVTRFPFDSDFGRVRFMEGRLRRIVEASDLQNGDEQNPFVNTGVYKLHKSDVEEFYPRIGNNNAKGEYYLTDLLNVLAECCGVAVMVDPVWEQYIGVNTRKDLAKAYSIYRRWLLDRIMEVSTVMDPETTYVGENVVVGQDTVILPNTFLLGTTVVGEGCEIGPNAWIKDSFIGDNVHVYYSVVEGAHIGRDVIVGPFARLRPGTRLADKVRIGNFVEVKNSSLGEGTKANHLSYIGDAQVGAEVNIGAGTITCNYDGYDKNRTVIGNRVFIGSDTILVAPVELEDESFTAAGSVITERVPKFALGIGRARQVNKEGWVLEYRRKKEMK